jgi:hypothetical protein
MWFVVRDLAIWRGGFAGRRTRKIHPVKDSRGQIRKAGSSRQASPKPDCSREGATQQRVLSQSVQREQDRLRRVREQDSRAKGQDG